MQQSNPQVRLDHKLFYIALCRCSQIPWCIDTRLLWLDLSAPLDWGSYEVFSLNKPSGIPSRANSATFTGSDDPRFFVFGGEIANQNTNSSNYTAPPTDNIPQFWYFNSSSLDWTLVTINESSGVENVFGGAVASDPNRNIGYYLDGEVTPEVVLDSPTVWVTGLVSFNFSDLSWKNETRPGQSTIGGFMEYVPVGKKGVLVTFGGGHANAGTDDFLVLVSAKFLLISRHREKQWLI